MADGQDTQVWNPVDAIKQKYPNMGLSDQQIYQNLTDPNKFRSAFPEYSKMSDGDIRRGVARFATQYQQKDIPTSGTSTPQGGFTGGNVGGEYLPPMTKEELQKHSDAIMNSGKGVSQEAATRRNIDQISSIVKNAGKKPSM